MENQNPVKLKQIRIFSVLMVLFSIVVICLSTIGYFAILFLANIFSGEVNFSVGHLTFLVPLVIGIGLLINSFGIKKLKIKSFIKFRMMVVILFIGTFYSSFVMPSLAVFTLPIAIISVFVLIYLSNIKKFFT